MRKNSGGNQQEALGSASQGCVLSGRAHSQVLYFLFPLSPHLYGSVHILITRRSQSWAMLTEWNITLFVNRLYNNITISHVCMEIDNSRRYLHYRVNIRSVYVMIKQVEAFVVHYTQNIPICWLEPFKLLWSLILFQQRTKWLRVMLKGSRSVTNPQRFSIFHLTV